MRNCETNDLSAPVSVKYSKGSDLRLNGCDHDSLIRRPIR
jgi:hypothetical protein